MLKPGHPVIRCKAKEKNRRDQHKIWGCSESGYSVRRNFTFADWSRMVTWGKLEAWCS